jgi:YD repeat-containing protein
VQILTEPERRRHRPRRRSRLKAGGSRNRGQSLLSTQTFARPLILTCNTANTFINFAWFNDSRLKSQEEWGTVNTSYGDGVHRTITYAYDGDGSRATTTYPGPVAYTYDYTGRDQLLDLKYAGVNVVSYTYDDNGNPLTRTPGTNPASSFVFDALNRAQR